MKKILLIFLLIVMTLSGCTSEYSSEVKPTVYKGKNLDIGVIGSSPDIEEASVKFTTISFEDLEDTKSTSERFDGIFIMQNHLKQADEEKYINVYKEMTIPIFFVGTTKGFLPFVLEDLTYEDAPDIPDSYIAGYLQKTQDEYMYWGFGLNDGVENESSIKEIYTRVLKTIETLEK